MPPEQEANPDRSASTPEQRWDIARRILREVQYWTDTTRERLPGRWEGTILHTVCLESGELGYTFEQAHPVFQALERHGYLETTKGLRGTILTTAGAELLENFDRRSEVAAFRDWLVGEDPHD